MASSTTRSQRRLLGVFVVLSLAGHLLLIMAIIVPPYVRKMRDAQVAAEAQQQARNRAQQRKQEVAKAAEQEKKDAAARAAEEARKEVATELHKEFKAMVGNQLKEQDADQMWAEILAQLTAGLDDYSHEAAAENASDAVLGQDMTDLQAKMLAEMSARLRERSKGELADTFIARVQNDVAPKLIEYHRKQLQTKIGASLRDAGTKIVQNESAEVRTRRAVAMRAIAHAEAAAQSAASGIDASRQRIDTAARTADALRKTDNADVADKRIASAIRYEKSYLALDRKNVETAGKNLEEAVANADDLSPEAVRAIHKAASQVDDAVHKAAKVTSDAEKNNAADLTASLNDAIAAVAKLAEAVRAAKQAASQEQSDPILDARTALKKSRDEDLKKLIEDAFWQHFANHSAPRLGDKLTEVFRDTLEKGGIHDKAVVDDVAKRVKTALLDGVRDKIKAGEAGTDPLTRTQHLDEVGNGAAHGSHAGGKAGTGAHDGQGAHEGDAADESGKSARQDAVAQKIGKIARDLVHANIDGAGDDEGADAAALDAALGKGAGGHGKGDGGVGDAGGLAGLADRVGRLSENVKSGRTNLADAARAGNGAGAGAAGMGAAGGFGAGFARTGEIEHFHGALLRYHARYVNEAEYAALTAGIHDRDRLAAQGKPTTRRSAEGEAATAAVRDNSLALQPAVVLVPPEPKSDTIGQAAKTAPFNPGFKNIRFAAIPYRSKPITIDGDLSEWADVPQLPMTPVVAGHVPKPGLKQFPQAVKIQWDNTGFYLAYDVKDADDKITRANPNDFWEGDGIEFWVDTLNTKEKQRTQCSHQFWAWVEPGAKDPTRVGGEARSWPGKDEYIGLGSDMIKTASKRTPGGWTLEVFIPAERFRMLELQPGRILGMNFSICTGTDLYYYWAGTTDIATARRPDTWGDVLLAGSAGRLECVDKLSAELKGGEKSKSLSSLRIGQPLRVRVSDADMNLSNTVRDRVAVTVSTRGGTKRTMILEETGDATGVFEGVLRTCSDTGAAASTLLPLLDGDSVAITYIDQCRPDGSRDVPVKLSLPTAAAITNLPPP